MNTPAALPAGQTILQQLDFLGSMDSIPHGILLMDTARRVIAINNILEALVGYARQDVIGVRGEDIIRSNLGAENDPISTVLASGETMTMEGDMLNQARKKIPIRFTISPLKLQTGNDAGVMLVLEDISLYKDLGDKIHGFPGQEKIIGHSDKMLEILELLPIVARTDSSALITGETGTGKDFIAECIHKASNRSRHPFIKVNCGALPESLLESELFGHVRGAFTGAHADKPGMFRLAHCGTIYLTEIGDLPLALQVKLLTVFDDKEFYPLGGSKKVKVDARIIAATHRDLREYVKQGKFREDLFFRLNVLRMHLPALRERDRDIRLLIDHFVKEFVSHLKKNIKGVDESALVFLMRYSFPGNVRELRNIIEYAVNICPGDVIRPEHLPRYLFAAEISLPDSESHNDFDTRRNGTRNVHGGKAGTFGAAEMLGWQDIEKRMILETLRKTGGKRSQAALILGWGRSTLWRKIKNYKLD